MPPITLTIDLEDPTRAYHSRERWVDMALRLLDFCDELQRRATFFCVGRVAESAPRLVQEIVWRGHEAAYHTHNHVFLTEENPERFKHETFADKDRFEQLTGKPLLGFRAPGFSLVPETVWALEILKELGFRYSSSVMPTRLSRFGFARAPRVPFMWENGLIEFPLPVATPLGIPYSGGVYLYAMPQFLSRLFIQRADPRECLWTYVHPFDFDVSESFAPYPLTPLWTSWIMWKLRKHAEKKTRAMLVLGNALPFAERVGSEHFAML